MKKILFLAIAISFAATSCAFADGTVDINSASLAQLETITGIGPTYAQRIIDGRPYSSVDDLVSVKGIGTKTLAKIEAQGTACVNCQTTIEDDSAGASDAPADTTDSSITATTTPSSTPAPAAIAPIQTYPSGVVVNELLPDPVGPDATDEWIELYNQNSSDVDLSDWQLKDEQGTLTTFTIPQNTSIAANGFLVFKRPDTNIELNNAGDGVQLLDPNGTVVDSVAYTNAQLGESYNKTNTGWQWSGKLTPGAVNIVTALATVSAAKNLPAQKKSDTTEGVSLASDEAAVAEPINTNQSSGNGTSFFSNPWTFFWTVVAIALIAGAAFAIKIIFFKPNVRS